MELLAEPSSDTCQIKRNLTTLITPIYEGIPETLVLNLLVWCFLLLLFAILRNRAWDYGRLALVQNEKITQMFYGNTDDATTTAEEFSNSLSYQDQGCCSWLPAIFTISKEKLLARCGPDAALYLSLQKHLMFLMAVVMVVSLTIILPLNFQGQLQGTVYTFGHTTLSNLDPSSRLIWVHMAVAFAYIYLSLFVMQRCASSISLQRTSSRTIMVTNISPAHRNCEDIVSYFSLLYPNVATHEVNLAYDIAKLMRYDKCREDAYEARVYCQMHNKDNVRAHPPGCFMCCCLCPSLDGHEFFLQEEQMYSRLVQEHREWALASPLGIAFVTFESASDAKLILKYFAPGTHREWVLHEAPAPSDIFWQNLSVKNRFWYLKAVLVNTVLFVVLFFLTTPAIIVNSLSTINALNNIFQEVNPIFSEFLPTLLLWTISALLPVLVAYSDEWLSHWTRSKQNLAIMQKTFIFLLFMILILPSLGLTSVQAFLEWSLESTNRTYRWECVFLPDKGAVFVNYVMTSALIGTALELIRFPELSLFLWKYCVSRSRAEIVNVQRSVLSEFPFGVHYAWMLAIYTIVVSYSVVCPLITPFGLLYFCLKHIVDSHNLYFAYRPTDMGAEGRHIHRKALRLVLIAVILLFAVLTGLCFLRGGDSPIKYIAAIGFSVSCTMFSYKGSGFWTCMAEPAVIYDDPSPNVKYIAPVLMNRSQESGVESPVFCIDYGSSNSDTVENSPQHPK